MEKSSGPMSFSMRWVYTCDVCGHQASSQTEIMTHLAEHNRDADSATSNSGSGKDCTKVSQVNTKASPKNRISWPSNMTTRRQSQLANSPKKVMQGGNTAAKLSALKCYLCNKIFKSASGLRRHIRRKHKTSSPAHVKKTKAADYKSLSKSKNSKPDDSSIDADPANTCPTSDELDTVDRAASGPFASEEVELQEVTDIFSKVKSELFDIDMIDSKMVEDSASENGDEELGRVRGNEDEFGCHKCQKRLPSLNYLKVHMVDKHEGWLIECDFCGRFFLSDTSLKIHLKNMHRNLEKVFNEEELVQSEGGVAQCLECYLRFRTFAELERHHHPDKESSDFTCPVCTESNFTLSGLKDHLWITHFDDRPYLCERCYECFSTEEEQEQHKDEHTKALCVSCGAYPQMRPYDGWMKCSRCLGVKPPNYTNEQPTSAEVPNGSWKLSSDLLFRWRCALCEKEFQFHKTLRNHQVNECDNMLNSDAKCRTAEHPKYKCPLCNRSIVYRGHFHRHMREVHPTAKMSVPLATLPVDSDEVQSRPRYECPCCHQLTYTLNGLRKHLRKTHPEPETMPLTLLVYPNADAVAKKVYSCGDCQETFMSTVSLANHRKVMHEGISQAQYTPESEAGVKKTKKCNDCGAVLFWRGSIRRHAARCHGRSSDQPTSTGNWGLSCDVCGRRFDKFYHLQKHLEAHMASPSEETQPCLCTQCGRRVADQRQLRLHMQRHTGIRPHKCAQCPKSFFQVNERNRHFNAVHLGKQPICDRCGYKTRNADALRQHLQFVHAKPGTVRPFPCDTCSRRFWSESALRRHMPTHDPNRTSNRKSMCALCKMLFLHTYNLTNHINTTHGDDYPTPYACATCEVQFETGTVLKAHYIAVHKVH